MWLTFDIMRDYMKYLSTYVELISDDFQSTFTVVADNLLTNMMGFPGDFENLTNIIQNYIPGAELKFKKTGQFDDEYDIYMIALVGHD